MEDLEKTLDKMAGVCEAHHNFLPCKDCTAQEVNLANQEQEEEEMRNPEEDVLGGIIDIANAIKESNRDKIPYTDEQISEFAERALDKVKDGQNWGYDSGYLRKILEAGISVDMEKVKDTLRRHTSTDKNILDFAKEYNISLDEKSV
jgi:hypothetical protein